MSWLRVEDGFVENPKVMAVSDRAFRLHMAGMCFCARNLTDGILNGRAVAMVMALSAASKKHVRELQAAGLWLPLDDGGFEVKDYLEYNPPAERVKEERSKARDRMRRVRSERSGERAGERSATPRPDPSPTPERELDQRGSLDPPEQQQDHALVSALVDESLLSGSRIRCLLEMLPRHEIAANTREVLERKFAQLPTHFVELARQEMLAADGVRSPVRYLNGIADRMIRETSRVAG